MSINNPKGSPDGKIDGKEMVEKPPPRTYLELTQPYAPHRSFENPVKSAFSCPVRPAFTPGRQITSSVVTSSISTLPSSITPSTMGNPQPVITKAVIRPALSESQPVQTVVSTSLQRTSPLPVSAPMSTAPMASIIRGPTQAQPASSHLTHPAVQATYSSHVPRGAAAVASITTLKSSVATPVARAPHVYAPSMISSQSSFQKLSAAGYHINSSGLQSRAPSLSTLRATIPAIPKTTPSLSTSEVSRLLPSSSSNLMSPTQLISISRASETLARTTLIHSTTSLSKPQLYTHVSQAPEKGFYRPTAATTTVTPTPSSTLSSKPSISHHGAHLQQLPPSVHLTSYQPITAHSPSVSSHLPHSTQIGTVTSSLSQSGLQHHSPFQKVIAQTLHPSPIPSLQPSNIMSAAPTKPVVTSVPAIAVTTQSVPRPVASTGNTSTASIPVAKVYPQPLAITTRPSTESNQHQDATRSAQSATLYVTAPPRVSAVVTTAAPTSIMLPASGSSAQFTSNTASTEARSVVQASASYQIPTAMTCYYEPLHGIPSLTVQQMPSPSGPRTLTAMSLPTLRAGLLPAHSTSSVALHASSVRPSAGKINPMIVAMNASPTRNPLTVTNTYSKTTENVPAPPTASPTAVASHSAILSYSSSSPVQAANPPTNPPSSPRPSILRKRAVDGANVAVRKNLLASMSGSQPVSPRPDPGGSGSTNALHAIQPLISPNNLKETAHENGQSSESTDSSCNGVPQLSIVIKQEPVDTSESSAVAPTNFHMASRVTATPMEASPRKKPRKQQLTGNELVETHSTEEDDEFEKEARDIVKKENLKEGLLKVEEDTGQWIAKRRRPPVTILQSYRQSWKSRHNHFMRYTDIRTKDEKRPTAAELSNQKCVIQKANGWKVHHICSQIDDLVELESAVHSRLASLLEVMEKKTGTKEDEDLDLNRANELMRGNIQRCRMIKEQMKDARGQVLKVLDHKARVVEIVSKFIAKSNSKRK